MVANLCKGWFSCWRVEKAKTRNFRGDILYIITDFIKCRPFYLATRHTKRENQTKRCLSGFRLLLVAPRTRKGENPKLWGRHFVRFKWQVEGENFFVLAFCRVVALSPFPLVAPPTQNTPWHKSATIQLHENNFNHHALRGALKRHRAYSVAQYLDKVCVTE